MNRNSSVPSWEEKEVASLSWFAGFTGWSVVLDGFGPLSSTFQLTNKLN